MSSLPHRFAEPPRQRGPLRIVEDADPYKMPAAGTAGKYYRGFCLIFANLLG